MKKETNLALGQQSQQNKIIEQNFYYVVKKQLNIIDSTCVVDVVFNVS